MNEKDVNLGFLFNKEYYRHNGIEKFDFGKRKENDYTDAFFKTQNNRFKEFKFSRSKPQKTDKQFDLSTVYPGLAIGLGYGHGIKAQGEFKLGFYFDYTSGLPQIPASSVKGTLRAYFPNQKADKKYSADELEIKASKRDYIRFLLFKAGIAEQDVMNINIDALEAEIFEGKSIDTDLKAKQLGIYERDIFYDAEVVEGNLFGKVLGDDSITPHTAGPLKNPVPLLFMKVLPNVTFRFEMDLKDSLVEPLVTAAIKYKIFRQIIAQMGIGAKTNVGYGHFKTT